MVTIKVEGMAQAMQAFTGIELALKTGLTNASNELLERVDAEVVNNLGNVKYGSGEINRYNHKSTDDSDGTIQGRYWNDSDVGMYREFGTGPVGEAHHAGISPEVHPVYTQTRWFIPVDQVDVDLEAVYGIPKITLGDKEFFMTRGQPARPWMYPAFQTVSKDAEGIVERSVNQALKGLQ
ncbi:hypothetical protein [Pseudolactococcus reticulitermitis]|uniref:HK97 gp10 family phage protein n=1 Tax=Pseudolactococcus reticulitermitis TaxID=2025039 RepID=A0A224WWQ8_9LACT|nr:hypothetical protein [Lactococcus reticulitermitis]GAX46769.1 hypothetical protein RsY01_348 [Lactococcus reticulitermitis]